ncbi:hypothetical protein RFI_27798 [Reticulomyxa filosa]|uniref:Protein kinase domain-containing protein n=1 Tax=Reticulomyxa filosa TaxID=46433 RepID=X6M6F9_RETFI|nr:hypothetical protein RFI_27798 [Reticulomyxa filosa]|eukprot:ETO09578.1 hypothetical protein RFI_27798 [Reticulomyxa filosa]
MYIAHRDVKPENVVIMKGHDILVTQQSCDEQKKQKQKQRMRVKLIDFGSGITLQDEKDWNKILTECSGTLNYMSPERYKPYVLWQAYASDVWSVGVICYEMLFRKRLFALSNSPSALKKQVTSGAWTFPEHCQHHLAEHFIQSLLTLRPNHRCTARHALKHPFLSRHYYQSSSAWQQDLYTYLPKS